MRRSMLILLAGCCSIIAATYSKLSYINVSSEISAISPTDSHYDHAVDKAPIAFPNLSSFHLREIIHRPLFNPSRRPSSHVHSLPTGTYRLRGLLLMDRRHIGLLERRVDGLSIRVSQGQFLDVWQAVSINSDGIVWADSSAIDIMSISQAHGDTSFTSPLVVASERGLSGSSSEAVGPPRKHEESTKEKLEWDAFHASTISSALLPPPPMPFPSRPAKRPSGSAAR
jgi:hypothetical protein